SPDRVALFDLVAGKEAAALEASPPNMASLAFSPDGQTLFASDHGCNGCQEVGRSENGQATIFVWDAATGRKKKTFPLKIGWSSFHPMAVSPDGKTLAVARDRIRDNDKQGENTDWLSLIDLETDKETVLTE